MSLICTMRKNKLTNDIAGACAHCKKAVYESLSMLDDAYNVWAGKCPHCGAINMLSMVTLRGYSSAGMDLVLPSEEEKAANDLPADCPSIGSVGTPANLHGTSLGEILHKLKE